MRFALLVALAACAQSTPSVATDALEVRSYDLPAGYAARVQPALARLLHVDDHATGRIEVGPGGELFVIAPASVQEGIAEVVRRLAKGDTVAPPANIGVDYWVVMGVPSAEHSADPRLAGIADALAAIEQSDGTMAFTVQTIQSIHSLDGEEGEIAMQGMSLRQVVSRDPVSGRLLADIQIHVGGDWVRTKTRLLLEPDQTTVLAEVGNIAINSPLGTLYTIVRPHVGP